MRFALAESALLGLLCTIAIASGASPSADINLIDARSAGELDAAPQLGLRRFHRRSSSCKVHSKTGASTAKQQSSAGKKKKNASKKKDGRKSRKAAASNTGFSDAIPADLNAVAFKGQQGPGIASWFQTDSKRDSTNGMSWCQLRYHDSDPIFAPSVGSMLGKYNGNYEAAAQAHCGMIARVVHPGGKVSFMVIGDGFDDAWIRKPGSIDITSGAFAKFNGAATNDKNVVVQNVAWTLTGQRSKRYSFKGPGSN